MLYLHISKALFNFINTEEVSNKSLRSDRPVD